MDGLAGDAGRGVQVGVAHGVGVGVGDPGHLTLASTHVGGGYVDAGSQEGLLGQLNGEPTGDTFEFSIGVQFGVNANTGLAAAKGDVGTGALVGHQGCQGLDLVGADIGGVPGNRRKALKRIGIYRMYEY